mmetsp:Transcript_10204/g.33732  ORF Transcript_10204/g.33732 Transcript_10204/m.33732 type:complete len:418 (-) Transcript_10204:3084-4337(-)
MSLNSCWKFLKIVIFVSGRFRNSRYVFLVSVKCATQSARSSRRPQKTCRSPVTYVVSALRQRTKIASAKAGGMGRIFSSKSGVFWIAGEEVCFAPSEASAASAASAPASPSAPSAAPSAPTPPSPSSPIRSAISTSSASTAATAASALATVLSTEREASLAIRSDSLAASPDAIARASASSLKTRADSVAAESPFAASASATALFACTQAASASAACCAAAEAQARAFTSSCATASDAFSARSAFAVAVGLGVAFVLPSSAAGGVSPSSPSPPSPASATSALASISALRSTSSCFAAFSNVTPARVTAADAIAAFAAATAATSAARATALAATFACNTLVTSWFTSSKTSPVVTAASTSTLRDPGEFVPNKSSQADMSSSALPKVHSCSLFSTLLFSTGSISLNLSQTPGSSSGGGS